MSIDRTPHDPTFRKVFSDPQLAPQFISHYLPQPVVDQLDLSYLELEKKSFVDDELLTPRGDLLFRTRLREGGDALVYVLLEHKSSPSRWVGLQMLKYVIRIWYRELEDNLDRDTLPPVIPMVFYHGKQTWNVPLQLSDLVPAPEALKCYVPDFTYDLVNCADIPDETLKADQPVGGVMLVYKHAFDEDFDAHLFERVSLLSEYLTALTTGERVFALLKYLASLCDNMPVGEFARTVRKALPKKGDELMPTVLDQILEEGRKEGFQEGAFETLQESVAEVLEARFETVPADIADKLGQIDDEVVFHGLLREAARVDTLMEFRNKLDDLLSEG